MRQIIFKFLIVQVLIFSTSVAFSQTKQSTKAPTLGQKGKHAKKSGQNAKSDKSDLGLPPPVVDLIPASEPLVDEPDNHSDKAIKPILDEKVLIQPSEYIGTYVVKTIVRPMFCDEVKLPFKGESYQVKFEQLNDSTAYISFDSYRDNKPASSHFITASIFRKHNRIEFIEKDASYLHYCGYVDKNQMVLIETEYHDDPVARHTLNRYVATKNVRK